MVDMQLMLERGKGHAGRHILIQDGHVIQAFCRRYFECTTGIKLSPGESREIQSIEIKLK